MDSPVELFCVGNHQLNIGLEHCSRTVLVPFALVLHVFESDGLSDKVAVVGGVLPCRLILEKVRVILLPKVIDDLQKDNVQALLAVLLLPSSALIVCQVLILVVVFTEAVRLELLNVRGMLAIASTVFTAER